MKKFKNSAEVNVSLMWKEKLKQYQIENKLAETALDKITFNSRSKKGNIKGEVIKDILAKHSNTHLSLTKIKIIIR